MTPGTSQFSDRRGFNYSVDLSGQCINDTCKYHVQYAKQIYGQAPFFFGSIKNEQPDEIKVFVIW